MQINKNNLKIVVGLIVGLIFLISPLFLFNLRINTTPSYPYGLYKVINNATIEKGIFVNFCAPDKKDIQLKELKKSNDGICLNGTTPLLKKVVAIEGDKITVANEKIYVNGIEQVNSKIFVKKVKFFAKSQTIKKGEIFVMSDFNPMSYDSRYFGAINTNKVIEIVSPLYTFN